MQTDEQTITVKLTDKNGDTTLVMSRNDSNRLNFVQWPLKRLEPDGYHALCQYLGDTMLRMLLVAYPAEFGKHPRLTPPKRDTDNPHGLVHALIGRSYKEKTTDYIAVIDKLIERNAAELSDTELPDIWKAARLQLIEIFSSGHAT
ncbi:MAG: hypothetical protein V4693_10685 [Pseudomonadota bacterium]